MAVFSSFLFTLYLSFNSLNLRFFFNPSSPLDFLSRKLPSCLSLFISSSILRFNLDSFFLSMLYILRSYSSCHLHTYSPNQTACFCNALAFQILDRFIDSICLNFQNLLVHFLKHNAIACSFVHHYFL